MSTEGASKPGSGRRQIDAARRSKEERKTSNTRGRGKEEYSNLERLLGLGYARQNRRKGIQHESHFNKKRRYTTLHIASLFQNQKKKDPLAPFLWCRIGISQKTSPARNICRPVKRKSKRDNRFIPS
jgi:hypothetical protein